MVVGHPGHHGLLANKKQAKSVYVVHEPVPNQRLNLMVKPVKEIHWK
jgi:hypothetical protein